MVVDIKYLITIIGGIVAIGGIVVKFFQMQTRQNMKIDLNESGIKRLDDKTSKQASYQIETEKKVGVLCEAMANIKISIDEIKTDVKSLLGRI